MRARRSLGAATIVACAAAAILAQDKPAPAPGAAAAAAADEKEFIRRVNDAVDRGHAWVKQRQGGDGGYGLYPFHQGDYPAGQTALAALARIASGENQHGKELQQAFAYLQSHPPLRTYEIGLTLMAFDAKAAPVGERIELEKMTLEQLRKYTFPRVLEPGEREFLQPLVERLGRERFRSGWSYGGYGTGEAPTTADTSNTQYAVLGFKAASRLGLAFDRRLLAEVLEYFLDHQEPSGKQVKFVDLREGSDGKAKKYSRRVEAKGWAYTYGTRSGPEVCASRTCIGIACIVLALDDLLAKGQGPALQIARRRRQEADAAIESGLAWLSENFAVDHHPPKPPGHGYEYYYLYALERTGALTSRRFIGEHDWYREGAEELLLRQKLDGSWPSGGYDNELVNTCFALLFLRRATLRSAVTGN